MDDQPTSRRCPIDVFGYLDYRQFLADFYAAKKQARGFSYRAFSRIARLGAPNYLKLVIMGKRNLTPAMAARFATACALRGDAAQFFQRLVAFNQATTAQGRDDAYAKLSAFARYREAHKLELAHAAYHSNWYIPAIRELAASPSFIGDPNWIAGVLTPPIAPHEARQALEVLIELGLLQRSAAGRLQQGAAVLSTGAQTRGIHITRYHAEMMRRATAAMELVPAGERDISSLTLCMSSEGIARLKERIQAFRRELIELAEKEGSRDRALQVNFQLFPLSTSLAQPAKRKPKTSAVHHG